MPAAARDRGLRLVVYDATDTGPLLLVPRIVRGEDGTARGTGGLTRWWKIGSALHTAARRADAAFGATSWDEAMRWVAARAEAAGRPVDELQAWGHGGWGYMGMGDTRLDASTDVATLSRALAPGGEALVWLRCCSAFGADAGRAFAPRLAERLGARVAGHTFIIGFWQSGTHALAPGRTPTWSAEEGTSIASSGVRVAEVSRPGAPRTITCLRPSLPATL